MDAEYTMLRKEMDSNIDKLHTYVSVVYTAVIALTAYIVNNMENLHLYSLIFVVLISIATRIRALLQTNMRISAYMEVFLETTSENYSWETLSHMELQTKKQSIYSVGSVGKIVASLFFKSQSIYLLIDVVTFIIYVCTIYAHYTIREYIVTGYLASGIFNVMSLMLLIYMAQIDANKVSRAKYKDFWIALKTEMYAVDAVKLSGAEFSVTKTDSKVVPLRRCRRKRYVEVNGDYV